MKTNRNFISTLNRIWPFFSDRDKTGAHAPTAMSHANPQRTGVYHTKGVDQLGE